MTVALRVFEPDARILTDHAEHLRMPLWLPWPLPSGWQFAGHGYVGDTAMGTVVACRGPNPVADHPLLTVDVADLLIATDEPGTGLGSALAGLPTADPGPGFGYGPPQAKAFVGGHPTSMWWVADVPEDRAVYAGEAEGRWLWVVIYPGSAGALIVEPLVLVDVRELGHEVELLPYGVLSPRLTLS
jgi:hypothetical protein